MEKNFKLEVNTLKTLASALFKPIYIVGGAVRNFLINGENSGDIDIAGDVALDEIEAVAGELGLKIQAVYPRTFTMKFKDRFNKTYEFTSFRKDIYENGLHLPTSTLRTSDIELDAKRRDFKCNAVYYDVVKNKFIDVLGGIDDIKNRIISTTIDASNVFAFDGLRLLRLCRFSAELNFKVESSTFLGAKENADKIRDIKSERILDELKKMLQSDSKYEFSDRRGHYNSLKLCDEIGVLEIILPELTRGKGIKQREDFHKYDVLEHSLKTLLYSNSVIREVALFHDVGKPATYYQKGNFYEHEKVGEKVIEQIYSRLKAPKDEKSIAKRLVKYHMLDINLEMKESKIKRFIVDNLDIFPKLLLLKQADYSGCKDDLNPAPTILKWQKIYEDMIIAKTPLSLKELNISGGDLLDLGYKNSEIGVTLKELFYLCVVEPSKNERSYLLNIASKKINKIEE